MVRAFAKDPGDRDSIPGRITSIDQKWYLMSLCLTLSILRCRSWIRGANQKKELRFPYTPVW